MTYPRKSAAFVGTLFLLATLLVLTTVFPTNVEAQQQPKPVRIVVLDVPEGGTERLFSELQSIDNLDVRDFTWFMSQVKGRGFRADTILDKPSDLRWVMSGSDINFMLRVVLNEEENGYIAHFIEAESGTPRRSVPVDLSESGLSAAGAAFLKLETERITGAVSVGNKSDKAEGVALLDEEVEISADDPEVVRAQAAGAKKAVLDRLKRDWLWLRGGFRLIGKDVLVASSSKTYLYASGMMPGLELDVEAYPLSLSNPDMASAGMYLNYYHGFETIEIPLVNGDILTLPINHFGIEGGAIYRMDSPLEGKTSLTSKQVRLKLGARYTALAVGENEEIPSSSVVSIVLGARLVFPAGMPGLAIWVNADLVPVAFAGSQAQLYGQASHSYGFGTELGLLYEFYPGLGAAVGYGFQAIRTGYTGEGILDGFEDSLAFELVQGMRISLVYQY